MTKVKKFNNDLKDEEYNELLSYNSDQWLRDNKRIIQKILPDIKVKAKTESQKNLIKSIKNNQITICTGYPGSGKTYVSVAYALNLLRKLENNRFKKLYLVKSVTTLKGEELGFIKGDINEKLAPSVMSYMINLEKIIPKNTITSLVEQNFIEPFPLAYMRGVSLDDCIIIADECIGGDNKIILDLGDGKNKHVKANKLPFYYKNYDNLRVLSYNENKKINEFKPINSIRITNNKKTLKIATTNNNNDIIVTENHPFAVLKSDKIEYKPASKLNIGDFIIKRKNKPGNHSILNENNYDILLGFILGDGSLVKNDQKYNHIYRILKQHGISQKEYNEFCSTLYNTICDKQSKSGFTGEDLCKFQSKSYFIKSEFVDTVYKNNKKNITKNCINYFTERTLATWFMDDGSNYIYTENGCNITIHTEGFTKKENENLIFILNEKFNIQSKINTVKKRRKDRIGDYNYYYNITLNNENGHKLQKLICKYVHPSIDYKLNKKYRNKFKEHNYFKYENDYDITTTKIENISEGDNITVYNMEVEGNNNYYVNNILTHNCQNISMDNSKTILTRIGTNTKLIMLGDVKQVDLRKKNESSLEKLVQIFENVDNIGVIKMDENDKNIRNPLIDVIEEKFDEYYEKNNRK